MTRVARYAAIGFLVFAALPARAATQQLVFSCGGSERTIEAMENEYIAATGDGGCWFHTGHHTYDMGALYEVGAISGSLFSVEVEFSPPIEFVAPDAALAFEGSTDGLRWTTIAPIHYALARGQEEFDRHAISFSFDAGGAVARYLRIRQPLSAAQGLSGYLDASGFTATVEPVEGPPPSLALGTRSFSCAGGIMEGFWLAHPCWFGGINRYDSPSVFHTYPIGSSVLDRVRGSVTFLPWRSDDYSGSGGSRTDVKGFVEVSNDGTNWTNIGTVSGQYGAPIAFDFGGLGNIGAQYVRLVCEYHKGVRGPNTNPALKHVRGFVLDSSIEVSTLLPE